MQEVSYECEAHSQSSYKCDGRDGVGGGGEEQGGGGEDEDKQEQSDDKIRTIQCSLP